MTDAAARWRIVTVAELGAPVRLAALAESIFGARNRPSGWFARKLKRECVDPRLSSLALTADRDPTDPTSWLGYVLVGTPSSLGGAARTAGTGVLASARRRGIASALIEAAADNVRNVGKTQLQLLAEPDLAQFYSRRGFAVTQQLVTLVRPSQGPPAQLPANGTTWDALPLDRAPETSEPWLTVAQWLPETWHGTEATLRHTVVARSARAHISREGRALLVHRLLDADNAPAQAAAQVLQRLPAGHPVVLPMLAEVSPITDALLRAGWHPMQRSVLLDRRVSSA
ncbi:MAG: GNAT family N-acetyltransferase [Nannocystaceae bacterium]|nr:GNAT family N-acetyltransferase [Nannocystaceae bacterium]